MAGNTVVFNAYDDHDPLFAVRPRRIKHDDFNGNDDDPTSEFYNSELFLRALIRDA